MIKIAVDLLGADNNETQLLDGVIKAINENSDLFVYAFGTEDALKTALADKSYPKNQLEIINSTQVITNYENPVEALQTKKDASIVKAAKLCKEDDEVGALVSCGATGALMVTSMMVLRPIGTLSPVLLCEFIKRNGDYICLSDCGANIDSSADKIVSFAKMATAYMKAKGVENPKVRLLSNGAEDKKGTATVKEAHALLKESELNFLGNVEGSRVLDCDADIIVTDGFAGNVLLKALECGTTTVIKNLEEIADTLDGDKKEALKDIATKLYKKYDYNTEGGAVLLGVKKPVIKGHGAANAGTVYSIIRIAYTLAKNNIVDKIKAEFAIS